MTTANLRTALAAGGVRARLSARLDRLSDGRFAAVLATPGLVLTGLFVVPPILGVLGLSLFRAELGRDSHRPFIALRNYAINIGNDAEFMGALPLTVGVAMLVTVISVPAALGAAALIHGRSRRVAGILSVILLLPWAVPISWTPRSAIVRAAAASSSVPISSMTITCGMWF